MRLEFEGKHYIYGHHLTVPISPLIPDYEKSVADADGEHDDENLIIHGDNLYALKSLLPKYAGRVKCIYIDPPYNTGNDTGNAGWVYNDRVNSPTHRAWFQKEVGRDDLERHDKWLCMMWPRLHLLRELLSDDGTIFISIDDNEIHHLGMLMDAIFGEENYVERFIWRSRQGRGATSKNTSTLHEYVIAYSRDANLVQFRPEKRVRQENTRERLRQWGQGDTREDRPTMYFPVESDEFGIVYPIRSDGSEGRWRIAESTMQQLIDTDLIEFEEQTDGRIEAYRIYPAGTETYTAYPSMFEPKVVKTTAHGSRMLKNILGPGKFPYPKPVPLIKEILSLCTKQDDIILDSFAGSGTTAQAVLALNNEDGGTRRFILVECMNYADSVTAERVRRVIRGVPAAKDRALKEGLGGSFSYCTLGDSLDVSKMLSGESLPSYRDMAIFVYHTATGQAIDPASVNISGDKPFYRDRERDFWLFYKPDIEWLTSSDSTFSERLAERVAELGSRAVVFAPHKFMPQRHLSEMGITFCQIPFAEPV